MINIIGIIPARYQSSRFPGKPLVEIKGKSMIQRVYEQARQSKLMSRVIVATDDKRIFDHVTSWGGAVKMTATTHQSGTDRIAEVVKQMAPANFVINIQGDEPFIQPSQIDLLCNFMITNNHFKIGTLAKKIDSQKQLMNTNVVKVVFNQFKKALYFSRWPIPFQKKDKSIWMDQHDYFKHIGLYAFKRNTLLELSELPIGNLEKAESLEQLRWLEAGYDIGLEITELETQGIDTPEDLIEFI